MEDIDLKPAVEKAIKNINETIADSELLRAFYANKAGNEKSGNKSMEWWKKENEQADLIKINQEFLEFISKNYK